jgi:hypothetical protein
MLRVRTAYPSRVHSVFLVRSVLLIFLIFCVLLLCVFTFWVPCCDVRYDFRIKTMFCSYLSPAVCRRAHILSTLFVFVSTWCCPTHIMLSFCFVFRGLMLPVSLDCPFLIALSVFLTCIHYYLYNSVSYMYDFNFCL